MSRASMNPDGHSVRMYNYDTASISTGNFSGSISLDLPSGDECSLNSGVTTRTIASKKTKASLLTKISSKTKASRKTKAEDKAKKSTAGLEEHGLKKISESQRKSCFDQSSQSTWGKQEPLWLSCLSFEADLSHT